MIEQLDARARLSCARLMDDHWERHHEPRIAWFYCWLRDCDKERLGRYELLEHMQNAHSWSDAMVDCTVKDLSMIRKRNVQNRRYRDPRDTP